MEFYREVMDSDLLNIRNLPEELKHTKVEVIILPYYENKKNKIDLKSISGIWKDSNIEIDMIREKAWKR